MTARRGPLAFVLLIALLLAGTVHGAPFTPGNLVIYRVNDGVAAIGANGTAVFLDEYTTAGVLVQSIPVPTTTVGAQRRLVCSGSATTEGFLTRSTDGQYVVFPGYDAAVGTAGITGSTSATVPRVIGRVGANGILDTSTALTDAISGGNPRSATSTNGTDLWLSGTSTGGGIRYATFGATTSTSLAATPTNLRVLGIFGSQLYTSSQSGAFRLATIGTGTPTTAGQTITNLPGFPTATGSPIGFFFADLNAGVAGVDTVYVADDGGTIQKYSLVGGNWTANGTIALATARGITGTVSGSNVTLYVTARTTLRTLTDTSGYNATITGSVTTLATVATNTAFQGVAFAPVPIVALPQLSISDVSQAETNAGTTTFTFAVTLNAPAGPGGVTFDIATADGTAEDDNPAITEDNDYVAQSLTGQNIPMGSTGPFNFNVTVNGDVIPEANETFFVNVTNVTGATVADGQGQGTIQNDDVACANLSINDVTQAETNAGTTTFAFTVSLSQAGCGTVTFDIATADGTAQDDNPPAEDNDYVPQSLTGQTITFPSTYTFNVTVNGDVTPESDQTFFVNITNVSPGNVQVSDGQGLGTIQNDDFTRIHDIQGNGAATPIPGATVTIEGVVTGDFQPITNDNRLSGFFVQEEDVDADADPLTSEGIFVFCSACPTNVAEGQRVQVTGTVSEFNNLTEITATTAGSVVITNAGNNLADVTTSTIDLPVVGVIDDFYEPKESMLVTFVDTLTVSEYFEQARYGRIELYEGTRPRTFNESNPPSVPGFAAHNDNLNRRRVYLDDDDNVENSVLNLIDGQQFVFHPQANGGLSARNATNTGPGVQGTDFFRGGDTISSLTGILHFSFSGGTSPNEWRVRPVAASPAAFTAVNVRPPTPPAVGGAIRAASVNVLNYFTTLNVRGADSTAELNRQRERTSIVLCALNADVAALMEIENHPTNATITDLLADVNTRCGGTHPYTFVNTGGALGTDQIRVLLIYRTGVLSPVGAPLSDMDAVHNRPPTAQTFDVVDALNPAFGQRFTALGNHSKSKGCGGASGADLDQNDGQACFAATRLAQANRIITWVNGTVIPAAGDPDVLMLGDFNAYPQETSSAAITSAGFTDLETAFLGSAAYSYLFDGQIGHIDYAWSSASLTPQVTGVAPWHINADENPLFDYNDEIDDGSFEQAFEEKPDGSALATPRVMFQPATAQRASDHDPVLLGIFEISDIVLTKTDSPDPVTAGTNLTYTITVTNNGPDAATNASWTDTLTGTTFVSMPAVAGWSCTPPAVGSSGLITCTNPSFGVGSSVFTLTVNVPPTTAAGTVLSNTATATSASTEGNPGDESDTETTTVATSADLLLSKTDSPDPVTAGNNLTYQITLTNSGPSNAASASFSDVLPAGTTFVSLSTTGPWSCTTPAVGANGTVSCTNPSFGVTVDFFTIVVNVDANVAAGTVLSNTATLASTTPDPNTGNESDTETTTVATSADLLISKTDSPDPVTAGNNLTYQITLTNNGPSNAASASFSDALPAGTTFVSLSTTGPWSCTTPAVGANGTVSCTNPSFGVTVDFFTIVVNVDDSVLAGTVLSNTATLASATSDPSPGNESDTETTTVVASADLQVTKTDSPDPVTAGNNLTYTIGLSNVGPSDAAGITFSDTIPANTTFVSLTTFADFSCSTPAVGGTGTITCTKATSLAGGSSGSFTLVVNVNAATADGTVISNTATFASTTTDPSPGNESATAMTTVGSGSADVSVTKSDSPDPVIAGNNLTYTITVNNAGPSNATTVALADTLPTGTTFVSLSSPGGWSCTTPAVGGTGTVNCSIASLGVTSAVFTLTVNVDASLLAGNVLSNTATVTSATTDPNTGNETDTETTTVGASADVQVTKTDAPDPVTAGTNITYTITATNPGPSDAQSVTLADTVPTGTTFVSLASPGGWSCATPAVGGTGAINCSIATFPAAGNAVFTLIVNADPSLTNGTVITNTATVASTTTDPSGSNNNATATTTVGIGSADLSITKTDAPDPVNAGANLTYTITVNNAGPTNASTVGMSDTLPANTTFVSLSAPGGWSCITPAVGAAGTVTCTNPNIGTGNFVFTLTVAVAASTPAGTVISNTATVTSTTADPAPGNESATATTTVLSPASVTGTKTVAGTFVPGGAITYTIILTNAGPSTQQNNPTDEFVDVLPATLDLVSATATSGIPLANVGTNTVTWNGSLAAGASVTITINATIDPLVTAGTTINNFGTIHYDADGNGTNESTRQTDNPAQPGSADQTGFVVAQAFHEHIPTLDEWALMALAAMLAALAMWVMKR
ncbi:MAG TPA: ExeM/NucH family extracellular endonuclease [Thermoanaerobaculia bacterium]|jgi:uncharacterized repeat protein (TIGR01451 family)|nr:ExeM/NucH family extracellular endonuclease [Thermoanaerobaculia bacterium]